MVPYLAVGLFAGVLADRVRRKPLLVGTDLGRAIVLAGVPLLAATGHLNVPVLAALMVVFGLLSVLNAAAHQSFLPACSRRAGSRASSCTDWDSAPKDRSSSLTVRPSHRIDSRAG